MSLQQTPVQLLKQKMKQLNFYPKKFLGQNFLINPLIIHKIISQVKKLEPSFIIEVGPGLGSLTQSLILLKCPISVAEIDRTLCKYWKQKKLVVLEGDILQLPWKSHLRSNTVLVSNLPYQIASRLMIECCVSTEIIKGMVFMFQKEVAQRIMSVPGLKSYGLLSVLSQCFWTFQFVAEAAPSDFYPRPQVAGQVLIFKKKQHKIKNPSKFLQFVKICFSQRRKVLLNLLKDLESKQNIINILNQMNLSVSVRAEALHPEQFVLLFDLIKKNNTKAV